ncbi:MAG: hypothetical protein WBH40_10525 [Ignavibacteriaceae bacterium]
MQTFTYSLLFKIIFRFGNIIVTLLLSIYLIPVFYYIDQNTILFLPLIIGVIIIFMVNRAYLTYYLILPYKIEVDDEKMICSDFLLSKKIVTIYFKDIEILRGGVFNGRSSGIMKLRDSKSNLRVGFSQKMNNSEKLIALILSKVSKDLYDEVISNLTEKRHRKKANPK